MRGWQLDKKSITNKKYKDTVFRILFNNKKEALGLYNNLFNASYADESLVDYYSHQERMI